MAAPPLFLQRVLLPLVAATLFLSASSEAALRKAVAVSSTGESVEDVAEYYYVYDIESSPEAPPVEKVDLEEMLAEGLPSPDGDPTLLRLSNGDRGRRPIADGTEVSARVSPGPGGEIWAHAFTVLRSYSVSPEERAANKGIRSMVQEWCADKSKAERTHGNISTWDTSRVTDMSKLMEKCEKRQYFNEDISKWDTSRVTTMGGLFMGAAAFNQDISEWDVSRVTSLNGMFSGAVYFNQPLERWDTSRVTNMAGAFWQAASFDQPLAKWDVSKVKYMGSMFYQAEAFNQPLNEWKVDKVENMAGMFWEAVAFNQPLDEWKVAEGATNTEYMFDEAAAFDREKNAPWYK
jgi:surface protein